MNLLCEDSKCLSFCSNRLSGAIFWIYECANTSKEATRTDRQNSQLKLDPKFIILPPFVRIEKKDKIAFVIIKLLVHIQELYMCLVTCFTAPWCNYFFSVNWSSRKRKNGHISATLHSPLVTLSIWKRNDFKIGA